jgi:ABC-2 type transport system permease protein
MSKIGLIAKREYITRVRKKSFLVMTLIGPLLFAALMIIPAWIASSSDNHKTIEVLDESGFFKNKLKETKSISFVYIDGELPEVREDFQKNKNYALLYIPKLALDKPAGIKLYSENSITLDLQLTIERILKSEIEDKKLLESGIDRSVLASIKTNVSIDTKRISAMGEEDSSAGTSTMVGFVSAALIYFFIFLYGIQILRGVIEEKSNRIVEVIISSVKPFQLMMGKIVGIALVGLTQFLLWVSLTFIITTIISTFLDGGASATSTSIVSMDVMTEAERAEMQESTSKVLQVVGEFQTINLPYIAAVFLFYFLGGYLLYGSLFAAVGAAVDSETETQQFMLPITMPLVIGFVVAQIVIRDPTSPLAFWMSMIPFTSPVVMMVRLPFGVPMHEIFMSMALLITGFVFTTWLAARIYRVGILLYGKKITYKELSKWLFYKA